MAAVNTAGVVEGPIRTYTSAAAQLRGQVVKQGASDGLVATATANDVPLGVVAESQPTIGAPIGIVRRGEAVAIAGAAVAAGAWLKSDGTGRVVATTTTGDNLIGQAVTSAAAAGDEILIEINKGVY